MCYVWFRYFTGILLCLCVVHYCPRDITVRAVPLNGSEEIKKIFSLSDATESVPEGASKIGNFAEGGLININLTESTSQKFTKGLAQNSIFTKNVTNNKNLLKKQSISPFYDSVTKNNSLKLIELSTGKTLLPTKLTETGSNLFLGVPEVVHINGTSSIKPRKGVHFNKIVPRKGVDNENESTHDYLENKSCFQMSETECYNATGLQGVECSCCKEDNTLGKSVKQQVLINCKNCKPINIVSPEKEICRNICCNFNVHDIYSGSSTQDIPNNYLHYESVTGNQKQNLLSTQVTENVNLASNFTKKMVAETTLSLKKNFKLKPSLTKVPYDVEVVTEILSKTQQKVFVPIVVSVFLLPLFGILLFFLWRRAKEYWDKRYYKRMDFLIDGIYND